MRVTHVVYARGSKRTSTGVLPLPMTAHLVVVRVDTMEHAGLHRVTRARRTWRALR
jgi:hypothetical protein